MQNVLAEIRGFGCDIRPAEDNEMTQELNTALSDSTRNSEVAPLVAYSNNSGIHELGLSDIDIRYTLQMLYCFCFS